jgi:Ca2+-binding RTX toxin-like protein
MSRLKLALVLAALILIGGTVYSALTASNSVPTTRAGEATDAVTAAKLKPSACAAVAVTTVVTGTGTFSGGGAAELMLGSASADSMTAGGGADCLVGGGGNDTLNGGQGTDVCLGGLGTDTFSGCETQTQ